MKVGAKSVGVSRQAPRSSASTLSPSSVSSWARIAPVQPNPIRRTSTSGSLVAIVSPSGFRRPARPAVKADRRQRKRFVVLGDPGPVVVARPGEADQLPADHVAVAAVDRVGEEALDSVLLHHREEGVALDFVELSGAL